MKKIALLFGFALLFVAAPALAQPGYGPHHCYRRCDESYHCPRRCGHIRHPHFRRNCFERCEMDRARCKEGCQPRHHHRHRPYPY